MSGFMNGMEMHQHPLKVKSPLICPLQAMHYVIITVNKMCSLHVIYCFSVPPFFLDDEGFQPSNSDFLLIQCMSKYTRSPSDINFQWDFFSAVDKSKTKYKKMQKMGMCDKVENCFLKEFKDLLID